MEVKVVVTRLAEKLLVVARSIRNPVSSVELSSQARFIWPALMALAVRLVGAAGGGPLSQRERADIWAELRLDE